MITAHPSLLSSQADEQQDNGSQRVISKEISAEHQHHYRRDNQNRVMSGKTMTADQDDQRRSGSKRLFCKALRRAGNRAILPIARLLCYSHPQ